MELKNFPNSKEKLFATGKAYYFGFFRVAKYQS